MQASCKAPRRPGTAGSCRGGRCTRQPWRRAQLLGPYMESLSQRRKTTSLAAAAKETRLRFVAAAQGEALQRSSRTVSPRAGTDVFGSLNDDERGICNLMVSLLQHKSSEEARCIMMEVGRLAQSRRLLAHYSGVYANGYSSGAGYDAEEGEGGRTHLIRYLQRQQKRQEEEEAKLAERMGGGGDEEDPRLRWRRLFSHKGANGGGTCRSSKKAKWAAKAQTSSLCANAVRHQGSNKQQHPKKNQEEEKEEVEVEAEVVVGQQQQPRRRWSLVGTAAERVADSSKALLNVPRRAKAPCRVASFNEHCADRYGGMTASNGSLPSALLIREVNGSTRDDSVRYSTSFPSPGLCDDNVERNEDRAGGVGDEKEDVKMAPPALMATMCPGRNDILPRECSPTVGVPIPQVPSSFGSSDARDRTGLPPMKPPPIAIDSLPSPPPPPLACANAAMQEVSRDEEHQIVSKEEEEEEEGETAETEESLVSTETAETPPSSAEETEDEELKKYPWEFDD